MLQAQHRSPGVLEPLSCAVFGCGETGTFSMLLDVLERPLLATLIAATATFRNPICVGFIVGVALRAMSLRGVKSGVAYAPQDICSIRHRFQMVWVHTLCVPTEMVNDHPPWNRPAQEFIGESMCSHVAEAGDIDRPVALVRVSKPQPTSLGLLNVQPESQQEEVSVNRLLPCHIKQLTMTGVCL